MQRILTASLFLTFCLVTAGQYSLSIFGSMSGYCHGGTGNDLYNIQAKLNDSLIVEKIVDTNYFELHLPKFLVDGDLEINAYKYSQNILNGSLCIDISCGPTEFALTIPYTTVSANDTVHVELEGLVAFTACGSWPAFYFDLNCSQIECLHWDSPHDDLDLSRPNSIVFCYAEWLRDAESVVITAYTDSSEKHADILSMRRGETIKALLVSYGLDPKRVFVDNTSCLAPAFTETAIAQFDTPEEQQAARRYNLFVHIRPSWNEK